MVNQAERPSLPLSVHLSLPFPPHPSSVLALSSASSSAPPSLSTDFRGNNCFHFILFVRPFPVRSFKVLFSPFFQLRQMEREGGRATDRPSERPSSDFPILSLFFPLGRQNPFTQLHFLQKVSSQRSRGRRSESGEGKEGDKVPKQASKSRSDFRGLSFQFAHPQ